MQGLGITRPGRITCRLTIMIRALLFAFGLVGTLIGLGLFYAEWVVGAG